MTEEEKKAIKWLKELYDIEKDFNSSKGKEESNIIKTLLNLIDKQQKEIEFFKKQELSYMVGYYNGKAHQETATAIRFESNRYEQFQKHIEELRNKNTELRDKLNEKQYEIDKQQKEIKALKEHNEELAKFILNSGLKIIKSDKKDMIIDKDKFAKFKIE